MRVATTAWVLVLASCASVDRAALRRAELRRQAASAPPAGLFPGVNWSAPRDEVIQRFGEPKQVRRDRLVYFHLQHLEYGFAEDRLTSYRCARDTADGRPARVEAVLTERLGPPAAYPDADTCECAAPDPVVSVLAVAVALAARASPALGGGCDRPDWMHDAEWVTGASTVRLSGRRDGTVELLHRERSVPATAGTARTR